MIRRRFGPLLALVLAATPALAPAQTVLGDRQDGARITVSPGEILTVRLTSNPTTGYTWRMLGHAGGLRLLSQRYDPPPAARRSVPLVGRPGMQSFRVMVTAPRGRRTPLRFAYRRWWTKVGMARVWAVTAVVAGPGDAKRPR